MVQEIPLWVGLTTLPSRIELVRPTLESLLRQTKLPDRIFLSLPYHSTREDTGYDIPLWLNDFAPRLKIIRCEIDYGPATKMLGCMTELTEAGCLVLADDDMVYRPFFLEHLFNAQKKNLRASFSYWIYRIGPITVGQGADGFSFYTPNLDGIERYSATLIKKPFLRVIDDFWISAFLFKRKISIHSVRDKIPDGKDIYTAAHFTNQLQHLTGDLDRQVANKKALRYLLLTGRVGYFELLKQLFKSARARLPRTIEAKNNEATAGMARIQTGEKPS